MNNAADKTTLFAFIAALQANTSASSDITQIQKGIIEPAQNILTRSGDDATTRDVIPVIRSAINIYINDFVRTEFRTSAVTKLPTPMPLWGCTEER